MTRSILAYALGGLGIAAILIGLSNWLLGPEATASFFFRLLASVDPSASAPARFGAADIDSELRFYAVFWIAYGVLLVDTARNLAARMDRAPWLLGAFFLGGVGRLASAVSVGPPNSLFTVLMAIELCLPPLLLALWWTVRRS